METNHNHDQKEHTAAGQCPVTQHKDSAITTSRSPGHTTNKDWWPNHVNLEHSSPA